MTSTTTRLLFLVAGLYDFLIGLTFLGFGPQLFDAAGVPQPNHWAYIQFASLLLIVFGIMFFAVAHDPVANRNLIPYGMLLKLSYAGLATYYWVTTDIPTLFKPFAVMDAVDVRPLPPGVPQPPRAARAVRAEPMLNWYFGWGMILTAFLTGAALGLVLLPRGLPGGLCGIPAADRAPGPHRPGGAGHDQRPLWPFAPAADPSSPHAQLASLGFIIGGDHHARRSAS